MVGIFSPLPLYKRSHSATSAPPCKSSSSSSSSSFSCSFSFSSSFTPTPSLFSFSLFASRRFRHHNLVNISLMGFSCGDDFDTKEEGQFLVIEEEALGETPERDGMDVRSNGVEGEVEFWPIEHPMEPSDEDRPVKCPMPHSSVINEGGMQGDRDRYSESSLRKRAEASTTMVKREGKVAEGAEEEEEQEEPPVRAVRKRHHTLTQGDHTDTADTETVTPLLRMPPIPPRFPTNNLTVFQMLRQFGKFES